MPEQKQERTGEDFGALEPCADAVLDRQFQSAAFAREARALEFNRIILDPGVDGERAHPDFAEAEKVRARFQEAAVQAPAHWEPVGIEQRCRKFIRVDLDDEGKIRGARASTSEEILEDRQALLSVGADRINCWSLKIEAAFLSKALEQTLKLAVRGYNDNRRGKLIYAKPAEFVAESLRLRGKENLLHAAFMNVHVLSGRPHSRHTQGLHEEFWEASQNADAVCDQSFARGDQYWKVLRVDLSPMGRISSVEPEGELPVEGLAALSSAPQHPRAVRVLVGADYLNLRKLSVSGPRVREDLELDPLFYAVAHYNKQASALHGGDEQIRKNVVEAAAFRNESGFRRSLAQLKSVFL